MSYFKLGAPNPQNSTHRRGKKSSKLFESASLLVLVFDPKGFLIIKMFKGSLAF